MAKRKLTDLKRQAFTHHSRRPEAKQKLPGVGNKTHVLTLKFVDGTSAFFPEEYNSALPIKWSYTEPANKKGEYAGECVTWLQQIIEEDKERP